MQLSSVTQSEIRLTLELTFDLVNRLNDPDLDLRGRLFEAGFGRAAKASGAALDRVATRLSNLEDLLEELHALTTMEAAARINEELTELPIKPSIVEHDDVPAHMHWTADTATFDDHVMSDVVMALVLEVCENGTTRFGRCDAEGCDDLFYDATRNHSRRFCDDPRCASRTHTADHRARRRIKAAGAR